MHSDRRGWRRGGQLLHAHHCDDKIKPRSLSQMGHRGCEAIAGAYLGRTPAPWKLSQSMTPQHLIPSTVLGSRFLPSLQASEFIGT